MPDVVHICYPGIGGQAAVATGLAVEAQRSGVPQGIIFYGVEPTAAQYVQLCDEQKIEHVSILKKPGVGLGARKLLRKAVVGMNPRIVISHHHDTSISLVGLGLSTIFVEHHSNALKTCKDWILSTLAHRLSDHTVYLTEAYRDEVIAKIGKWHAVEKSSIIANGLDLTLYQPIDSKNEDQCIIGMQGRMDTGKDFETLLHAFAMLADRESSILELIGDGPKRTHLEQIASELGISKQVKFTGFLTQEKLIERMRQWHLAVLMTMGETLSMAILEAWALQLPHISTRVPGVVDLVQHETDGFLVGATDKNALADALKYLIKNPEKSQLLGLHGRRRVEQEFNLQTNYLSYLTLCNRILPLPIARQLQPEKTT